jgi:phosphatidylglycerol:prolipoprotein diacylglycerol transferase
MLFTIPFPAIDPVIVELGPFAIRWYALAYVAGLVLGWLYLRRLVQSPPPVMTRDQVDDILVWMTFGVVLGGRLGYVLFYKPLYYLENPLKALYVWEGGMSFHGGLLGVAVALILFARHRKLALLPVADLVACVSPIGLFFGRIANFINGELYGRPSDVPWAMVFPGGEPVARHPSQLYQAGLEGLLLFLVMYLLSRSTLRHRPGALCGAFLAGYAVARMFGELFREPDAHIGFLAAGTTMGQLLSIPMLLIGAALILWPRPRT